jgi:ubiquinone/menaquinone biosynthesis C-methylase UbiE
MQKRESTTAHWDNLWEKSNLDYTNKITDELEKTDVAGKKILEIGAGSGATAIKLAQEGAWVVCLDYSQKSIELILKNAASHGLKLSTVKADAFALPFKTETFDICYHQGFLEHFRELDILLAEQYRILQYDGILLADVPQTFSLYTIKKNILILIGKWFAGWETQFSSGKLKKTLTKKGFSYVSAFGRYHFRNLNRIQKKILGKTIIPQNIETIYYKIISWLENTWIGTHTAFSLGMIVKKKKL